MKGREVRLILREKYTDYASQVIESLKNLDYGLSGEDSNLDNVWEEFAFQLQVEHSIFFDEYEETIRSFIFDLLKFLPNPELKLLWLKTDHYFDYDENESPPIDEVMESVVDEIYSQICQKAEQEILQLDDDDDDY